MDTKKGSIDERRRRKQRIRLNKLHQRLTITTTTRRRLEEEVKCFGCGKKGHIARDCSHKKDVGQDGGNKKEEAYCFYRDASVKADSWIVDSGASCHMTLHR